MECWSDETQYSNTPLLRSAVACRLPASSSSPHVGSFTQKNESLHFISPRAGETSSGRLPPAL
jgi:hypothetical protein